LRSDFTIAYRASKSLNTFVDTQLEKLSKKKTNPDKKNCFIIKI